jgi:DhnA family fructose-bisphosphate aldolase class Ia
LKKFVEWNYEEKRRGTMTIKANDVIVPLDVPKAVREKYINNYLEITKGTGRLMLFAGDQKVEHMNDDFFCEGIHPADSSPEHLFRLMLFAGDQKVEHMNDDFYGEGIHPADSSPEHLFRIANQSKIGVFATQLGLIARYGVHYPDVSYLVKLCSTGGGFS